jgi:hypothetical protein
MCATTTSTTTTTRVHDNNNQPNNTRCSLILSPSLIYSSPIFMFVSLPFVEHCNKGRANQPTTATIRTACNTVPMRLQLLCRQQVSLFVVFLVGV